MKKLFDQLKGYKYLCFLDFEATQFSHEMIAYGAVFASLDRKGRIKKFKEPIKQLVKPKNKVGKFVEDLTGITKEDIDREGVAFSKAMAEIKKYCGMYFKKTMFITFGNHDIRILSQSSAYNIDSPREIVSLICKYHLDFQNFISEFIKDDKGNPYSLENYLNVFGIEFDGQPHDPKYDALNLMLLYDAFLEKKDIVIKEYLKVLSRPGNYPLPVKETIKRIASGQTVTYEDFLSFIKEYVK